MVRRVYLLKTRLPNGTLAMHQDGLLVDDHRETTLWRAIVIRLINPVPQPHITRIIYIYIYVYINRWSRLTRSTHLAHWTLLTPVHPNSLGLRDSLDSLVSLESLESLESPGLVHPLDALVDSPLDSLLDSLLKSFLESLFLPL